MAAGPATETGTILSNPSSSFGIASVGASETNSGTMDGRGLQPAPAPPRRKGPGRPRKEVGSVPAVTAFDSDASAGAGYGHADEQETSAGRGGGRISAPPAKRRRYDRTLPPIPESAPVYYQPSLPRPSAPVATYADGGGRDGLILEQATKMLKQVQKQVKALTPPKVQEPVVVQPTTPTPNGWSDSLWRAGQAVGALLGALALSAIRARLLATPPQSRAATSSAAISQQDSTPPFAIPDTDDGAGVGLGTGASGL